MGATIRSTRIPWCLVVQLLASAVAPVAAQDTTGAMQGTLVSPEGKPQSEVRSMVPNEPFREAVPHAALAGPPNTSEPAAAAAPASKAAGTKWRGSAPPGCRDFILTEAGISVSLNADPRAGATLTWDLGYMRNVSPRSAIGGSLYLRMYSFEALQGQTAGIRPRYRHWLGRRTGLDIGPGLVLFSGGDIGGYEQAAPLAIGSLNTSLALTYGDLVAVTVELDVLRLGKSDLPPGTAEGRMHSTWYAGARFGGWLGPVATGVLFALAIVAFAGD